MRSVAASEWRVSRFAYALSAAVAVHGLLLFAHARHAPHGSPSFPPPVELAVELDEPSPALSPPVIPLVPGEPEPRARAASRGPDAVALHARVGAAEAPHGDLTSNTDAIANSDGAPTSPS